MKRKQDAAIIEAHLQSLGRAHWLSSARTWWPKFVFHFTDVQNVVRILESGKLLSRSRCGIATDIASAVVINNTANTWKNYVRMYFRPRTPTQYCNEGFRSRSQIGVLEAHCPMPVFLLFDSLDVLTRETTQFSEGNLAAGSSVGAEGKYFASIPFEKVYHDSWMSEEEKATIKFHRHAEVLVPDEMDLSALKWIVSRSEAECETLLHLLNDTCKRQYRPLMTHGSRGNLFFRKWTFVESATMDTSRVLFHFNLASSDMSKFDAELVIRNPRSNKTLRWKDREFMVKKSLDVSIPQITKPTKYDATLLLNDAVAYSNRYVPPTASF